jgi:AcrR family transcriptional regulator
VSGHPPEGEASVATVTSRPLTPRGVERRRQLMDCAVELFATHGFDPTSVSDIVDRVGVGKGVFYWYFDGKEALLREILVEGQHQLRRRQREAIGDEPDPLRRLELGLRATMAWRAEHPHLVTVTQFAAGEGRFAATLRQAHDVALADIVQHVKEAIVEGQVRDEDPLILAHAIFGVTASLAGLIGTGHGPAPDVVAEVAVRFCLDGMRADHHRSASPDTKMYDA